MQSIRQEVLAAIHETKSTLDVSRLRDDVSLTDQGIDSLEIFNVLLITSERYDIEISDEDSDRLNTVNDIVEYVHARVK